MRSSWKDNWNIFVNIVCILLLFAWDWMTGESDIVYPEPQQ